jgi:hypothetical protein
VVVVVVLVAVTVVVTMVVVDGEVLLQKLLQTLELLLAVVVVPVVPVTMGMSVVVVVVVVMVVVVVAMVLVEESLDLIDEALIDQKLEGLPVFVVLDGTLQSAVEVQLKAEPDLLTFQLVLKLVEELTVVVAVVVVVVTVVAVVLVAMSVEVVVVVAVMMMGVDGDISIDFSHLGNSDVGLVGSAVVSMVVVMAVMMGMMNRDRGIIDVVTEVEDVGRLVGEFSVGGSRNDGGSEAEEGDGDDLGLHCGSCSLDRELES